MAVSSSAFADGLEAMGAFSLSTVGTIMGSVKEAGDSSALKDEAPNLLTIEKNYRTGHKNEVAIMAKESRLLESLQVNDHSLFVSIKF